MMPRLMYVSVDKLVTIPFTIQVTNASVSARPEVDMLVTAKPLEAHAASFIYVVTNIRISSNPEFDVPDTAKPLEARAVSFIDVAGPENGVAVPYAVYNNVTDAPNATQAACNATKATNVQLPTGF
ncbi:unnamed protein product [Cuscuta epithymum]|uniref:Uncharacterized protein n=1 Tax=Cuscuta epithymum TaxID=186058 RepID=A0AAV0EBD8_9ASTE|nr:unnamed protein product [Cuscuta epithymum]